MPDCTHEDFKARMVVSIIKGMEWAEKGLLTEGRKGGVGGSSKQIKPKESFAFNLVNSEHVRWATMCFYLVPYLF